MDVQFWLFFLIVTMMFVNGDIMAEGPSTHKEGKTPSSSQQNELVLIKYGGSAITDKASFETIKLDVLMKLAETIANNTNQNRWTVVVHGAGSFGHFQAKEFELKIGGHEHNWREGLTKTRSSVLRLSNQVVKIHIESNLAAVGIPLFPHVQTKGMGQLVESSEDAFITNLVRLLYGGFLPILHGDVVFDEMQRCSVFGGDFIMTWLASVLPKALQTNQQITVKTIFVTDVMGVYDMPPHLPNANLLREMMVQPNGELFLPQTDQHLHDVTGGIMKKIECARDLALMGCKVSIVPMDALGDALNGNLPDDKGTTVILR